MDSITHIAIGACIGDLFLGKKIGRKAMLYGAIAASLPDIDFIASFWTNTADDLLIHRGFTHSFLFALLAVLALAFFFRHRHRVENIPIHRWLFFLGTEIFIHLFLDVFNAYGVGWLEPFSHVRFSANTIFVADPIFSIWPICAAIFLLILKPQNSKRRILARLSLLLSGIYLMYCLTNKMRIDDQFRYTLIHQGVQRTRYFTTPTPFNNWLWFTVAEADSGFYIGYRSVFEKRDQIKLNYFPQNKLMIKPYENREDVKQLIRFSQGYFTIDSSEDGAVFNDLRFGQMMGWQNPKAAFVFHYYLNKPDANKLVVQRGRFSRWNWNAVKVFWRRIRGRTEN